MRCMILAGLTAAMLATPGAAADPPKLDGVWLIEAGGRGNRSEVGMLWESTVVVEGPKVRLTNFLGSGKPLTGTFTLDPKTPGTADVTLDDFDLTPLGMPANVGAGVRKAAYALEGDRLTLALAHAVGTPRPAGVGPTSSKDVLRLVAVRAPAGVTGPPKEVAVTVTAADGKPVAGVALTTELQRQMPKKGSPAAPDAPPEFGAHGTLATTGADGVARVKYADLQDGHLIAFDAKHKRMVVAALTPAGLAGGKAAVALSNQCRVTVPVSCPELAGADRPGWFSSYIYKDNMRFMYASGPGPALEFVAPAGEYTVGVYSHEVDRKTVKFTVPGDGRLAFTAPAVELKASPIALLRGKPAPEFAGVVGYHGDPFKLADFKGKYVVLDFWGYWCNPCTGAMPALFEVHDKFPGEVVVVTVHQDGDGEVKTAAELDAKLVSISQRQWAGRKLPLRTALISGRDDKGKAGGAAEQYGVSGWPTSILIGPDGKIISDVSFRDVKTAVQTMNRLMGKMPAK